MAGWKRSAQEFVVNNLGRSLQNFEQALGDVRSWFVDNLAKDIEVGREMDPDSDEWHEIFGVSSVSNLRFREACSQIRRSVINYDVLHYVYCIRKVRDDFLETSGRGDDDTDDYHLFTSYGVANLLYEAAEDMPEELREEVYALSKKLRGHG